MKGKKHYSHFVEDCFLGLMPVVNFSLCVERIIALLDNSTKFEYDYN